MEFKQVLGNRRSIRYFEPDKPVEKEKIQTMLEAANRASRSGNIDYWKALVVYRDELDAETLDGLRVPTTTADLDLAPVQIYFFADLSYADPNNFKRNLRDLVNVGAGLSSTYTRFSEFSARKVMDMFLRQLPPEWGIDEAHAEGPLMSGPIPMGLNRKPAAVPGLLLVGDAVGATNPFNGEGIAYGMETGELAAELIGDALARDRPAVAQMYPVILRERYGRYFKAGNAWLWAIGHPRFMHFAVRHGFPREPLMRFALRVMANLTRGEHGDATDRLMHALMSAAPSVVAGGAG